MRPRTLTTRAAARAAGLVNGLWFLPSLIVVAAAALAVGLVRVDHDLAPGGPFVFGGDTSAARTVFQTLAGSLISVAGLTFSVTVLVLQLASSQFSPRLLPNFLGDRVTQLTVGTFVGVFIYSLIGLRSVGAHQFVPRLTVTIGSALGAIAVVLLIFFIHHISRLIQISETTARIGRRTLASIGQLYPEPYGEPEGDDPDELRRAWNIRSRPAAIYPDQPGYVSRIGVEELAADLRGVEAFELCVAPGDAVPADMPIAYVWPAPAAERNRAAFHTAIAIAGEREPSQDAGFGIRQLTDVALRAISPSVNDPTTAVTCIVYIRSALVRLATKRFPARIRSFRGGEVVAIVRRRELEEYLSSLVEIGRYAGTDARVADAVLGTAEAVANASVAAGAPARAELAVSIAEAVSEPALAAATSERDRERIAAVLERARAGAGVQTIDS